MPGWFFIRGEFIHNDFSFSLLGNNLGDNESNQIMGWFLTVFYFLLLNKQLSPCRLQHTDVDVPHFTDDDHNFVKGAFHTIDRPYDKLDPYVSKIDYLSLYVYAV
jgi:hypothetical protein